MMTNVTCPACQHKYWLQEGDMGSRQICPNCQSPFFAGASVAEARPGKSPAVSAAPAAVQASYAKTMIGDMAPPIKYSCPRCKSPLEAAASEAGTKKNCPNCTQRHQIPAAPKPVPAAAAPTLNKTMIAGDESAAAPRPPIKYNCPNCKKPLEAPAEQGGTKTNCPACNQRLQIPAAPPVPVNRNKTMLASDESAATANAASGGLASVGGAHGSNPLAASPAPAAGPWATLLTPRNVIIGILVVLLLVYVVPAFVRGGKEVDKEALSKTQLELEKLKAEIELKKKEMDRQAEADKEKRRQFEQMMHERSEQEARRRQDEQRRLREADDEEEKARLKKKFAQEQQQREAERREMERKQQQLLEDAQRQLADTKKALESSQQKQQTIIQQPAPVIHYPPYSPYYYRPWWW